MCSREVNLPCAHLRKVAPGKHIWTAFARSGLVQPGAAKDLESALQSCVLKKPIGSASGCMLLSWMLQSHSVREADPCDGKMSCVPSGDILSRASEMMLDVQTGYSGVQDAFRKIRHRQVR